MTKITHVLAVAVLIVGTAAGIKASFAHRQIASVTAPDSGNPNPCPGVNCPLLQ